METISQILDFVIHLDVHMSQIMADYGALTYVLIFLVVFCETGLVITPFLPGDSLIFIIGTLSIAGGFNIWISAAVLVVAAFAGDNVNYQIGKALGPRLFKKENARFFSKKNLERTHAFYEKHGGKTIIIARFIPVIRTFAPFVGGMGKMTFRKYILFCISGAVLWVAFFLTAGYFLGKAFPDDLEYVIFAFLVVSSIPTVVAILRERSKRKKALKNAIVIEVAKDE